MKRTFSRIHIYIVIAVLATIFIDQSGLLTKSIFEIYKVEYSGQNVVTKIKLDPSRLDVALSAKDKESLNLVVYPNGFGMSSVLTVKYSGAVPIFKDMNTQGPLKCSEIKAESSCRLIIKLSGTEPNHYVFYTKNSNTVFYSIDVKSYRAKKNNFNFWFIDIRILYLYGYYRYIFG